MYSFSASAKNPPRTFIQTISLKMTFSGDLSEAYQFDGILGDHLFGVPEKTDSKCENKSLFRAVIYQQKKMIEVWVNLTCTLQGQKLNLKPHRFFVERKEDVQNINWPVFDEKIKKVNVQIQGLLVKTPKGK
ncbi:MAG: hypothetical protein H7061_01365 [Bdellovibrionaceae bacterium]|nr:hypothetical protein [Bdellovibrio sp.]